VRISRRLWAALAPVLIAGSLPLASAADAPHHSLHRRHHHRVESADQPHLRSTAALVFDETHSTVLYARRSDVPMPIASITKLMTALVVADAKQPLDEVIEISGEDCSSGKGAFSRLRVGTRLTRGDLIHLALMSSENRAAHALGRNYPGGLAAFVHAMNHKASTLGMTDSHFVDPTGLSSDDVASAADLAKLVSAAAADPVIRDYSTDAHYAVRVGRRMVEFRNTDSLVRSPAWMITVQKTGYISEAGRCLVMQAQIEDRTVVIVLLNSFGKYTRVADARRIRRWMESTLSARATHTLASSS